jgi:hypothetical protein
MFVVKIQSENGKLITSRGMGGSNNDKANGITYFGGYVYVAGESDSPGWSSMKTDMIFIKLDDSLSKVQYAKSLGGSGEDQALVILGNAADGDLYALG